MAYNPHSSLLSLLLIFNVLFAITQVTVAGRNVPATSKTDDKKQPEWFIEPDGSVLIPGVGRVMVPYLGGHSSYTPYSGGSPGGGGGDDGIGYGGGSPGSNGGANGVGYDGGSPGSGGGDNGVGYDGGIPGSGGGDNGVGSGGAPGGYIPGGDDTFVPNPGVEVPNPVGGGGIPAAALP